MQSGTTLSPWALSRSPRKAAFTIGAILDIFTDNSTYLVSQLRRIQTAKTLQAASVSTDVASTMQHNPLDGLVFGPSIEPPDAEDAVVTGKSHQLLQQGDVNRVPVMVGFNTEEGVWLADAYNWLRSYLLTFDIFSTRLVPKDLNIESNLKRIYVALQIRANYFGITPIVFSTKKLVQFITDDLFARPIHEYARQISKWNPTYMYIFSYEGQLGTQGQKRKYSGVDHGEELYYLWAQDGNVQNLPAEDMLVRRRLLKLWTNFIKTGNPTPSRDPLLNHRRWPSTDMSEMYYLNIGRRLQVLSNFTSHNIQFWKDIYDKNGNPPYDTY